MFCCWEDDLKHALFAALSVAALAVATAPAIPVAHAQTPAPAATKADAALTAAIRATPADQSPWVGYAGWLRDPSRGC